NSIHLRYRYRSGGLVQWPLSLMPMKTVGFFYDLLTLSAGLITIYRFEKD
ncbi:hypothetical protein D1BOALGB6SA_1128, partial [Olavius sp. associated proteobacterium Delta 1]